MTYSAAAAAVATCGNILVLCLYLFRFYHSQIRLSLIYGPSQDAHAPAPPPSSSIIWLNGGDRQQRYRLCGLASFGRQKGWMFSIYVAPQAENTPPQWGCASHMRPAFSLGCSPSPQTRTLVCSHTTNGLHPKSARWVPDQRSYGLLPRWTEKERINYYAGSPFESPSKKTAEIQTDSNTAAHKPSST